MRIGMVTTWGSYCGIATYSEQLCTALKSVGVQAVPLVPQNDSRTRPIEGFEATEAWLRDDSVGVNVQWLRDVAEKFKLEAIHFQHEFGLFRDSANFLRTVRGVAKTAPVYVTLHTTPLSTHFLGRHGWLAMLKRHCAAIITHTLAATASVAVVPGKGRAVHIEHGTPDLEDGDERRGLEILGLGGRPRPSSIGLSLGFISGSKNVACTVLGFGEVLARKLVQDDACFFVAGDTTGDPQYLTRSLRPALDFTGAAGVNLHLIDRFIDGEDVPHLLAAVDYCVLNTVSDNLSASGQVHQLAAAGVAAAVANKPIYIDGVMHGAIPFDLDPLRNDHPSPSLLAAIGALATDQSVRRESAAKLALYGRSTSWGVIAKKHAKLYHEGKK